MNFVTGPGSATILFAGIVGLLCVGIGIYWFFDKQARLRDIEYLRKKLDLMQPSDPEYNAVRALHTSMVIDAHRFGQLSSDGGSGGHGGDGGHSGGHHGGDHGGGHGGGDGGGGDGH